MDERLGSRIPDDEGVGVPPEDDDEEFDTDDDAGVDDDDPDLDKEI